MNGTNGNYGDQTSQASLPIVIVNAVLQISSIVMMILQQFHNKKQQNRNYSQLSRQVEDSSQHNYGRIQKEFENQQLYISQQHKQYTPQQQESPVIMHLQSIHSKQRSIHDYQQSYDYSDQQSLNEHSKQYNQPRQNIIKKKYHIDKKLQILKKNTTCIYKRNRHHNNSLIDSN